MAIRKPIFIIPHDLGTIATGNAQSGFPVSHLNRHKAIGLVWKSSGNTNVWARGQFAASRAIDFCALVSANALAGTNYRLRLGGTQAEVDGGGLITVDFPIWDKYDSSITADALVAPDGTTTADQLSSTITGGSNTAFTEKAVLVSAGQDYTFSVYVKQGTSPTSALLVYRNSPFSQVIGIINWSGSPAMAVTGSDVISSGLEDVGNGWYRAWISMNSGAATIMICRIYVRDQGTGNVSGHTVGIWGAELRAASAPAYDSLTQPFISPSITREDARYHSHLEIGTVQNATWWRIDITGHTGDFQASNLVLGSKVEPSRFYNADFEFGVEDLGSAEFTRFGVMNEEPGVILRTATFSLAWQTEAEFEASFRPMMEKLGKRGVLYSVFDPDPTTYRQSKTFMGILRKPLFARAMRKPKTYQQDFDILSFI